MDDDWLGQVDKVDTGKGQADDTEEVADTGKVADTNVEEGRSGVKIDLFRSCCFGTTVWERTSGIRWATPVADIWIWKKSVHNERIWVVCSFH